MNENIIAQFFLIILFAIAVFSCKSDEIVAVSKSKISFTVDSMRIYPAEQNSNNNFIFSPLTDFDKVWTMNFGNSQELDLSTGEWVALSDKYDKGVEKVREEYIWRNHDEREVFISLFSGLFYFDLDRDTFYQFEINSVTALVSSEDRIIVGTDKGEVFNIDKETLKATLGFFFSDTRIMKLEVLNKDSLSINEGEEFYVTNLIGFKSGTYLTALRPWYYERNAASTKHLPGNQYNTFKDEKLIWHFSPKYLFVSDTTSKLYKFHHLPYGNLKNVKNDEQYLYLLFNDKFVILNKGYILKKAKLFDINAFQAKKLKLNKLIDTFYNLEVDSFLQTYHQIKSDSSLMTIPENAKRFEIASFNYFSRFRRNAKRLGEVENALNDNLFPAELEPYALFVMSNYYLRVYNSSKLNFFSSQLISKYPEFKRGWHKEVIECSRKMVEKIDSLSKLNLPKDEWLYKEAQLKMNLVYCGAFGGNYYDYSIVAENYEELLSKFPNSQYADNAAFYFIQNYFDGDGDWAYSEELEKKIQNFLLKYPNTELVPEVQRMLASLYAAYLGSQNQNIEFKEKGLVELEKIDLKSIKDSILISYIVHEKKVIERDLAKETFDITISPTKEYKLDDKEMIFKVIVKNKTSDTRSLNLFSDTVPLGIHFYSKNDYQFIENPKKGDTIVTKNLIPPNDSIVDYINLRSNVRNMKYSKGQRKGDFSFTLPGYYYISASSADKLLRSKQIEFYIHEN